MWPMEILLTDGARSSWALMKRSSLVDPTESLKSGEISLCNSVEIPEAMGSIALVAVSDLDGGTLSWESFELVVFAA